MIKFIDNNLNEEVISFEEINYAEHFILLQTTEHTDDFYVVNHKGKVKSLETGGFVYEYMNVDLEEIYNIFVMDSHVTFQKYLLKLLKEIYE